MNCQEDVVRLSELLQISLTTTELDSYITRSRMSRMSRTPTSTKMSTGPQSSSTTTCLLGTPVTSPLHSFQLHESFHNIRIAPVNKELFKVLPSPNNEKMSRDFVSCSNIPTFVEDKRISGATLAT